MRPCSCPTSMCAWSEIFCLIHEYTRLHGAVMTTGKARCSAHRAFTLFCVLAVLSALGACVQSEWRELPVSDGAFSVLMRGEPTYARQQLKTPAGTMVAHLYSSDRPDSFFAV